jgi:hypothetical protein
VTEDLPTGEIVHRLGGRLVSTDELARLIEHANADPSHAYVDTLTIYEDAHLVLPGGSVIHFGNHSCDPNLWHVGPFEIATRRAVHVGEELTIDYGTQSGAPGFLWPAAVVRHSVVVWCRVTTGVSLRSRRGTGITGFPLWKLGLRPSETAPVRRTWAHRAARLGQSSQECQLTGNTGSATL